MCGIVAVRGSGSEPLAREMVGRLRHRGPDGEGLLRIGDTFLGHRRLAIIDLAGGRQPMVNERGDLSVVFNGEIYNHLELRRELEARHIFQSRSDTEVLLHLYEEEGEDMLRRLDGMFAFAIAGSHGLLVARDPLGIKPLYVGRAPGTTYIASELKAFPPVDAIEALPAGHARLNDGPPWRYALPFPPQPALRAVDRAEAVAEIRRRLERAVFKRLMSDVPVGVLLSGGLDSSVIAALMRPRTVALHSFTAGMAGAPDLDAAREVARCLGTEHHELVYTEEEVRRALPEVIRQLESFDAPLVRSAIPMYFICKVAAEHVKVALSGEGADELFAGYSYLSRVRGAGTLRGELIGITERLQDTNLQRADRMGMAHGLEVRVPFLDLGMVRYAHRLPLDLVRPRQDRPEKWLLREACRGLVPDSILGRRKLKFSEGAGSSGLGARIAEETIDERTFGSQKRVPGALPLRSREELYYYRIWREVMPPSVSPRLVGRTRDPFAAAGTEAAGGDAA
ncbi:MAG TPA: asparagine synthase-related protein [Spirochaetia bacterium]|nr:asparagine synthase-related protein [Spirochaetia bacterium]